MLRVIAGLLLVLVIIVSGLEDRYPKYSYWFNWIVTALIILATGLVCLDKIFGL